MIIYAIIISTVLWVLSMLADDKDIRRGIFILSIILLPIFGRIFGWW
jgi:hypothetical protein